MKYREIIADGLSRSGWSWGIRSHVAPCGTTLFCVDAHRADGKHYVVRSDELLTAFLELETQVRKKAPHDESNAACGIVLRCIQKHK